MAEVVKGGGEVVVAGELISHTNPLPLQAFIPWWVVDMAQMIQLLTAIEAHLASITELEFN